MSNELAVAIVGVVGLVVVAAIGAIPFLVGIRKSATPLSPAPVLPPALAGPADSYKELVDSLLERLERLTTRVDDLENKLSTSETARLEAQAQVTTLRKRVSELEGNEVILKGEIERLRKLVEKKTGPLGQ